MSSHSIEIKPVLNKKDRKEFVTLLWDIYEGEPNWTPPLIMERMNAIDEKKNPYFLHAEVRFWVAYKDGKPAGRISAQIDELVEPQHGVKTGHYGFFVKDTWAYTLDIREPILPPTIQKLVDRAVDKGQVKFRPINMDKYEEELKIILDIFNDSWIENWKYIPFTEAELDHAVKELKFIIREDFTYIAEVDGVPQAMMVTLLNINEIIRDLDGKLFPFGIFKLLWRLKLKPSFKTVRVPLMGVRTEYQNSRLSGIMSFGLFEACRQSARKIGCEEAELSWVLEENTRLSKLLETIGCVKYKTYRLFQKDL